MFQVIGHSQSGDEWDARRQKILERGLTYWGDPTIDLDEKLQSFRHRLDVNAKRQEERYRKEEKRYRKEEWSDND
jgi:hypothetical protein